MVWTDLVGFEVLYEDKYYKVEETGNRYLICNCGDFLSSLTKGKLRSPWHQVIQPRNGVRNSLVYFYYPRHDHPVVQDKVYNEDRLLGLFVDQSKMEKEAWKIPSDVKNMGQMYAEKWR